MKTKFLFVVVCVVVVIISLVFIYKNTNHSDYVSITINNTRILARVADTPEKMATGLSGALSLPENNGMLFVFESPEIYSFWMKDMNFPIDIIWIDENFRVLDITKNLEPKTYPKKFSSEKPILYVLEVNAGFSDARNIQKGAFVSF